MKIAGGDKLLLIRGGDWWPQSKINTKGRPC